MSLSIFYVVVKQSTVLKIEDKTMIPAMLGSCIHLPHVEALNSEVGHLWLYHCSKIAGDYIINKADDNKCIYSRHRPHQMP